MPLLTAQTKTLMNQVLSDNEKLVNDQNAINGIAGFNNNPDFINLVVQPATDGIHSQYITGYVTNAVFTWNVYTPDLIVDQTPANIANSQALLDAEIVSKIDNQFPINNQ